MARKRIPPKIQKKYQILRKCGVPAGKALKRAERLVGLQERKKEFNEPAYIAFAALKREKEILQIQKIIQTSTKEKVSLGEARAVQFLYHKLKREYKVAYYENVPTEKIQKIPPMQEISPNEFLKDYIKARELAFQKPVASFAVNTAIRAFKKRFGKPPIGKTKLLEYTKHFMDNPQALPVSVLRVSYDYVKGPLVLAEKAFREKTTGKTETQQRILTRCVEDTLPYIRTPLYDLRRKKPQRREVNHLLNKLYPNFEKKPREARERLREEVSANATTVIIINELLTQLGYEVKKANERVEFFRLIPESKKHSQERLKHAQYVYGLLQRRGNIKFLVQEIPSIVERMARETGEKRKKLL